MLREVARRLFTTELGPRPTPAEVAASAVKIYARLLSTLSCILGEAGSAALFRRSLRLTEATYPFYSVVRTAGPDGLLTTLDACIQAQRAEVAVDASIELLTTHIKLLTSFIGQRLTEQLLREAWPDLRTLPNEETQE